MSVVVADHGDAIGCWFLGNVPIKVAVEEVRREATTPCRSTTVFLSNNDDPIFINNIFPPPCSPGLLLKVILSAVNLMFVKLESIQSRFVEAAVEKKFGTKLSGGLCRDISSRINLIIKKRSL